MRHDWWWLYNTHLRRVNNWTAVCNAGVVGAALYLEPDLSRLAEMIARAARSMDDFLSTFDADGGSSEGPRLLDVRLRQLLRLCGAGRVAHGRPNPLHG